MSGVSLREEGKGRCGVQGSTLYTASSRDIGKTWMVIEINDWRGQTLFSHSFIHRLFHLLLSLFFQLCFFFFFYTSDRLLLFLDGVRGARQRVNQGS